MKKMLAGLMAVMVMMCSAAVEFKTAAAFPTLAIEIDYRQDEIRFYKNDPISKDFEFGIQYNNSDRDLIGEPLVNSEYAEFFNCVYNPDNGEVYWEGKYIDSNKYSVFLFKQKLNGARPTYEDIVELDGVTFMVKTIKKATGVFVDIDYANEEVRFYASGGYIYDDFEFSVQYKNSDRDKIGEPINQNRFHSAAGEYYSDTGEVHWAGFAEYKEKYGEIILFKQKLNGARPTVDDIVGINGTGVRTRLVKTTKTLKVEIDYENDEVRFYFVGEVDDACEFEIQYNNSDRDLIGDPSMGGKTPAMGYTGVYNPNTGRMVYAGWVEGLLPDGFYLLKQELNGARPTADDIVGIDGTILIPKVVQSTKTLRAEIDYDKDEVRFYTVGEVEAKYEFVVDYYNVDKNKIGRPIRGDEQKYETRTDRIYNTRFFCTGRSLVLIPDGFFLFYQELGGERPTADDIVGIKGTIIIAEIFGEEPDFESEPAPASKPDTIHDPDPTPTTDPDANVNTGVTLAIIPTAAALIAAISAKKRKL